MTASSPLATSETTEIRAKPASGPWDPVSSGGRRDDAATRRHQPSRQADTGVRGLPATHLAGAVPDPMLEAGLSRLRPSSPKPQELPGNHDGATGHALGAARAASSMRRLPMSP